MNAYFAVCAPGLESLTAQEMRLLDLPAQPEPGGVSFKGGLAELYRANLHLRTAARVLARVGTFFHAANFAELRQRTAALPWERFLQPGQTPVLRVTCHKSRLYHSDAVGRVVAAALAERLGNPTPPVKPQQEGDPPAQTVIVRLAEDRCTISVDSSGAMLHRRGYRQAVARAPLRETFAAALLLASGWDRRSPLIDPFCGSGTIAIEAACLARNLAPGLHRRFAFMEWSSFDASLWQGLCDAARDAALPQAPDILACDRDAGAIDMARANAERAGVLAQVTFKHQAVSALEPPPGTGWVVTNPPYGVRLDAGGDLRDLYARFGDVLRRQCPAWHLAVLSSDPILTGQLRLRLQPALSFKTGGLRVHLECGEIDPR